MEKSNFAFWKVNLMEFNGVRIEELIMNVELVCMYYESRCAYLIY